MRRIIALPVLVLAACAGGGSSTGDGTWGAMGMTRTMQIRLVDAPSTDVSEIVVTLDEVSAHVVGGGGWVTLAQQQATVDLLKLQGGSFALLGVTQLPAGHVTELRLHVVDAGPSYVTTPDGQHHPLKVPSGSQSGIKLKGGFDLAACATGNITLDFDGKRSIFTHPVGAGAGDEWILRPVVRLKSVQASGGCGDGGAGAPGGGGPGAPGSGPGAGDGSDMGGSSGGGGDTGGSGGSTGGDTGGSGDMGGPIVITYTPNPWGVPIGASDPSDPCASVSCPSGDYCANGACYPLIL